MQYAATDRMPDEAIVTVEQGGDPYVDFGGATVSMPQAIKLGWFEPVEESARFVLTYKGRKALREAETCLSS